ncbi:hypothetical protein EPZ47_06575 [Pseudomonas viciae]|uniref:Uncharacterized protein n=1 Tax=Pseudomonas viciae TaxID=2505979 RepID=A0A4P7PEA3_9PSED|nr:hypothetical protein EPZ47_06575 [Pseudomonas viciae]
MKTLCCEEICAGLWGPSLLAKQAPRILKDRIAFIAGKPCSHMTPSPQDIFWLANKNLCQISQIRLTAKLRPGAVRRSRLAGLSTAASPTLS